MSTSYQFVEVDRILIGQIAIYWGALFGHAVKDNTSAPTDNALLEAAERVLDANHIHDVDRRAALLATVLAKTLPWRTWFKRRKTMPLN